MSKADLTEVDVFDYTKHVPLMGEYLQALGEFFHEYALMENSLNGILVRLADEAVFPVRTFVDSPNAHEPAYLPSALLSSQQIAQLSIRRRDALQALLGSVRLDSLQAALVGIFDAYKADAEVRSEFKRVFAQLKAIRTIRDRLAHNAASLETRNNDHWFRTFDHDTKPSKQVASTLYFKVDHLRQMVADLSMIRHVLPLILEPRNLDPRPLRNVKAREELAARMKPFEFDANDTFKLNHDAPTHPRLRMPAKGRGDYKAPPKAREHGK